MGTWGFWEWLGYLPILVAALILAFEGGAGMAPSLTKLRPKATKSSIWKTVPLGLLAISACSFAVSKWSNTPINNLDHVIMSWGSYGQTDVTHQDDGSIRLTGTMANELGVKGGLLGDYAKKGYRLVGVCFHHDDRINLLDHPNISKSAIYDIADQDTMIVIPWNKVYIDEVLKGYHFTDYSLLVVPPNINSDQFDTLHQAYALGAKEIAGKAGPP